MTKQEVPEREANQSVGHAGNQLHRKLSSFGVLLLTLSCLSPVFSIYGVGSDVLLHAGTGAAGMFICGIGVALVWAVVYAELGSAYPYAGGKYVGVGSILGPWAGVASLTIWAVTQGPVIAFLAKTIAIYVSDLSPAAPPMIVTFAVARSEPRLDGSVYGNRQKLLAPARDRFWLPRRQVPQRLDPAGSRGRRIRQALRYPRPVFLRIRVTRPCPPLPVSLSDWIETEA